MFCGYKFWYLVDSKRAIKNFKNFKKFRYTKATLSGDSPLSLPPSNSFRIKGLPTPMLDLWNLLKTKDLRSPLL